MDIWLKVMNTNQETEVKMWSQVSAICLAVASWLFAAIVIAGGGLFT